MAIRLGSYKVHVSHDSLLFEYSSMTSGLLAQLPHIRDMDDLHALDSSQFIPSF